MNRSNVLRTEGLTKYFGKRAVVNQVDLEVLEGDIYCLLGGNGAGKTTLFRLLVGLVWPTQGTVSLWGRSTTPVERKGLAQVGAYIERPSFCDFMSAYDNLSLVSTLFRNGKKSLSETLEIVGLKRRAHDKVGTFSYGMKKRLAIASSLIGDPKFLILDEPFSGLDSIGIREIWKILLFLNKEQKMTILFSNHIVPISEKFCNRIGIMHKGKVIFQGEKSLLLKDGSNGLEAVYLDLIQQSTSIDFDE